MSSLTPLKLTHYVAEPEDEAVARLSPIIFLHGLAASKEMWEDIPQVVANASKRKAYVIDQRDHGDNEWTGTFSFEILVDDLLHFMDENEIQKAILIGHSMGGSIAISTALKKPDRIEALIVEDMIVGNLPPEITVALKTIICKRYECVQKIPAELDEKEAFKKLFDSMSEILQTMPEVIRNQTKNKEAAYSFLKLKRNENGEWDFPANYKAIIKFLIEAEELMIELEGIYEGPTSFIYGTLSFLPIPAYEPQIKKYFPNAELVPIEGASHNITGDCPEELTKAILDFLSNINNEKN